ncbi:hypothetical protein [Bacillus phage vB_BanS-Thrax3]|nr:hypothetical protein [Bacillus phage vB_BanS-Thrax3]
MEKVSVIGFYKESQEQLENDIVDNEKLLYFVAFENSYVDGSKTWFEGYNVIDGHFELKDKEYLVSCQKITKEEYLQATAGYYTPNEYIK